MLVCLVRAVAHWLRYGTAPGAWDAPLDPETDWRSVRSWGRDLHLVDNREPHLSSDRRVDESLGPRVLPGLSNGRRS